jgi:hypothetical protein
METLPLSEFPNVAFPSADTDGLETLIQSIVGTGGILEPVRMSTIPRQGNGPTPPRIRAGFRRVAAAQEAARRGLLDPETPIPVLWEVQFIVDVYDDRGVNIGGLAGFGFLPDIPGYVDAMRRKYPAGVRVVVDVAY